MSGLGRGRGFKPSDAERKRCMPKAIPNSAPPLDLQYNDLLQSIKMKSLDALRELERVAETSEQVLKAMDIVYNAALLDSSLASGLSALMAAISLYHTIQNISVREIFVTHLQRSYEARESLMREHPVKFRNAVSMFGDFFHPKFIKRLIEPYIDFMTMLLTSTVDDDIELGVYQLCLNNIHVKEKLPQVINIVRKQLMCECDLSSIARGWLAFALEMYRVNFGQLDGDTQMFYANILGEKMFACLEIKLSEHTGVKQTSIMASTPINVKDHKPGFNKNISGVQRLNLAPDMSSLKISPDAKEKTNAKVSIEDSGYVGEKINDGVYCRVSSASSPPQPVATKSSEKYRMRNARPILGAGAKTKVPFETNWRVNIPKNGDDDGWEDVNDDTEPKVAQNVNNWQVAIDSNSQQHKAQGLMEEFSKKSSGKPEKGPSSWNQHDDRHEINY